MSSRFYTNLFLIAGLFLLAFSGVSHAQQNSGRFLVSWRAKNYAPPQFLGKTFPNNGVAVEIGFDFIDRNRIVDLSNTEIRWTLDNAPAAAGLGLKTFSFPVTK